MPPGLPSYPDLKGKSPSSPVAHEGSAPRRAACLPPMARPLYGFRIMFSRWAAWLGGEVQSFYTRGADAIPGFELAQVNIGRARGAMDQAIMAGFVAQLATINSVADGSPGFVWRLQTEDGDAT